MSYADRAKRFLADRQRSASSPRPGHEINEGNEERPSPAGAPAAAAGLGASPGGNGVAPEAVWWDDRGATGATPVLHLPPRGCIGPRACSRLGPCVRHVAGAPCEEGSK